MSTAAAIVLAAFAAMGAVWFALTRNGRHATRVLAFAVHRWLLPASTCHGLDQPAGVRDMLRGLAIAARVNARYWACMPLLWWTVWQVNRAIRQLAKEETPRAPVAASAPGEGAAPDPAPNSGAAPPATAPQPALTEPPNPAPNWAPPAGWEPYAPAVPEMTP